MTRGLGTSQGRRQRSEIPGTSFHPKNMKSKSEGPCLMIASRVDVQCERSTPSLLLLFLCAVPPCLSSDSVKIDRCQTMMGIGI